jgi:large subunit ribosomal protein L21
MAAYAIIEDSGTQIKVAEGDEIKVANRELAADAISLTFDKVLLVGGDAVKIGQPYVAGASVAAEILAEDSEKYQIFKYRRRKNYKRKTGHRQHFLRVRITSITA